MLKWGFSFLKKGAIGRIDRRLGLVEAGSGIETGKQVEVMTLAVVVIGLQAGSQQPAQGQRHENINNQPSVVPENLWGRLRPLSVPGR